MHSRPMPSPTRPTGSASGEKWTDHLGRKLGVSLSLKVEALRVIKPGGYLLTFVRPHTSPPPAQSSLEDTQAHSGPRSAWMRRRQASRGGYSRVD